MPKITIEGDVELIDQPVRKEVMKLEAKIERINERVKDQGRRLREMEKKKDNYDAKAHEACYP